MVMGMLMGNISSLCLQKGWGLLPIKVSNSEQISQHVTCSNLGITWNLGMSCNGLVCPTLRTLFVHVAWNFIDVLNYICVCEQFMMLLVREFKLICLNKCILTRYLSDSYNITALASIVQEHWSSNNVQDTRGLLTYNDVSFTVHWVLCDTTNWLTN